MKRRPYLVVFLLGWLLAVPAVFIHYPNYSILTKLLISPIRGVFPMLIGTYAVYWSRQKTQETQFWRGVVSVTAASAIMLLLAIWTVTARPS